MCTRVQCSTCHRPTYRGCGNHIEQVLGDVPEADRCNCRAAPPAPKEPGARRSIFGRRR